MRILQIINNFGSGGAESMLINFLKNSKDKADIDILLIVDDKIVYDVPEHIRIFILQPKGKRYSLIKLYRLLKLIRKEKYDIVHTHLFPAQYYPAIIKMFLPKNTKLITTEHTTTNNRRRFYLTRRIDNLIYSLYDHVIFISEGVKKQFEKDFQLKKNKVSVINNGISLKYFKTVSKEKKERIKLLMVARFVKEKDHLTLLKALSLLDNKFELSLVGVGDQLKNVKQIVKEYHLNNRVHFLGFQKNISDIYSKHDIFILSSNWEGFGLVAIEAMASGLPVIASDVDGLNDVVKGAGILFPPKDYKRLAYEIERLAKDNKLYNDLVNKGLQRAKKFDIRLLVDKTFKLYQKLTDNT